MKAQTPILLPLTDEAKAAVRDDETVRITTFPFRIGRECRSGLQDNPWHSFDRRRHGTSPHNDCYLHDLGEKLQISREHLQIEKRDDGAYEIFDRGSMCGTVVDGDHIGGDNKRTRYPLHNGSIIIFGSQSSPYVFKFLYPSG
ncbi:MAG: FHA domain-containing protein [Nitrospirae bacterium]|nr:FHA domain-containing protein [Nitrospirota bacterium]